MTKLETLLKCLPQSAFKDQLVYEIEAALTAVGGKITPFNSLNAASNVLPTRTAENMLAALDEIGARIRASNDNRRAARFAFEKYAAGFDTESDKWLDMTLDEVFIAGFLAAKS